MGQALAPGMVCWAEVKRSDGLGYKTRPVIVVDDEGDRLWVVAGSTQKASEGALLPDEFLIKEQELADMGLDKPGRFSCARGNLVWLPRDQVRATVGCAPAAVISRMFKAGHCAGAW